MNLHNYGKLFKRLQPPEVRSQCLRTTHTKHHKFFAFFVFLLFVVCCVFSAEFCFVKQTKKTIALALTGFRMSHGYLNNNFFLIVSEWNSYTVQVYKWDHTNNVFTNNMSPHQTITPGTNLIIWDLTFFKVTVFLHFLCFEGFFWF